MKKVNNPHDKLFKEAFSDPNVATDFMQHYLPNEVANAIDLTTLTPLKDSFIQQEMKASFSDFLFHVKINNENGYLYFLFEHKSYQEQGIAFQLLGYMHQIWSQHVWKDRMTTIPVIIPFVFYHGQQNWKEPKTIRHWIQNYDDFPDTILKYIPDFDFVLYDFSLGSELPILGNPKLKAFLELSKHIFTKETESFLIIIANAEQLLSEYDPSFLDTVLLYILSARDDISVTGLKEHLTTEGGKRLMSIADRLRHEGEEKGEQRGKALGKELGELNKARDMAKKLLRLNMDEAQIREITELSVGEIEEIKNKM